ncbi:MAG: PilZ domain-containing protein [Candidatus Hydrogenedentes bacterium]|nr:PilZ domain-containing protein [Candidatus Hydrogenedentota bacterium]
MSAEQDFEPYLQVGCPVTFQSDPSDKAAPRFSTVIRGWRKPSYILMDRPRVSGRFAVIHENQPCVVRFVRDGKACAFDTHVLDWDARMHNAYCRVEWPRAFQVVVFRQFERIKLDLPCDLLIGDDRESGEVVDLSIGGCRVATKALVPAHTSLSLSFVLPDGCPVERVQCEVQNVQPVGDVSHLGCKFVEGQICVESNVAFYITTILERTGVRSADAETILIIDIAPELALDIRRILQGRGYETLIATGIVDGLARLRLVPPGALLINATLGDLDGLLLTRLVRMTNGLESLPIFLYDGNDPGLDEKAKVLGASGSFSAITPAVQVVNGIVTYLMAANMRHTK